MTIEKEPSRRLEKLSALQKNPSIMRKIGALILEENDPVLFPIAISYLKESTKIEIEKAKSTSNGDEKNEIIFFSEELLENLEKFSSFLDNNIKNPWVYSSSELPFPNECFKLIKTIRSYIKEYTKEENNDI